MGFWSSLSNFGNSVNNALWGGMGQSPNPRNSVLSNGSTITNYANNALGGVANRQAPQAGNTQVGNVFTGTSSQLSPDQLQWRNQQNALASQLSGVANGTQMGAGEMAVRRQMAQAAAQQQSMAAGARGGNAALAARSAARNMGNLAVDAAGQSSAAAQQDQAQARNVLAGVLGQGREQDIGVAGQNAQLQQQMNLSNLSAQNQAVFQQAGLDQATSLANMQARLQQTGMNDQAALGYLAQLYGVSAAEMQARLEQENASMSQQGIFGDLLQAGGAIGAAYAGRK